MVEGLRDRLISRERETVALHDLDFDCSCESVCVGDLDADASSDKDSVTLGEFVRD